MAITSVRPKWDARGGGVDEKGIRVLNRGWGVSTDDDADGEPDVIDAVIAFDTTAAMYHSHPNWPAALCRSLGAEPNGSGREWIVKAVYSSAPFEAKGDGTSAGGGGSGGGGGTAPTAAMYNEAPADQRPPSITITRKEVTKVLEKDLLGKRIRNTVGDPFDPPPEVFRSHHVITWKFHRTPAQLNWSVRWQWHDSINLRACSILGKEYPALSLRCTAYDVAAVWDTGAGGALSLFFELTVQAEFNPDGWNLRILNTGRRRRVAGSITGDPPMTLADIVGEDGQPVADPVPLTEDGSVVPNAAPPDEPDYHYVKPQGYVELNWDGGDPLSIYDPLGIIG